MGVIARSGEGSPEELLTQLFNLLQVLVTKIVGLAELACNAIPAGTSPTSECVVDSQEVRILCTQDQANAQHYYRSRAHIPTRKDNFAFSASASRPRGVRKGDLELSVAAMVSAGSRQRNTVAMSRNFPR